MSSLWLDSPIVFPPPPWVNQDIVLYHGTIDSLVAPVLTGVQVASGRPGRDFGPGFYTTTVRRQAEKWAAQIAVAKSAIPAVIQIDVKRGDLAQLQTLSFVLGDDYADDYWSFVHHCRLGALDHGRTGAQANYDLVYGPVSSAWNQRMSITGADQVSFHTSAAELVLNRSPRKRII